MSGEKSGFLSTPDIWLIPVHLSSFSYVPNIELYREETGTWETLGQMRARRYGLSCACLRLRNDHVPTADEDDEYYKDVDVETDEETDYDDYDDYVFFGPNYDYYEELRLVMGEWLRPAGFYFSTGKLQFIVCKVQVVSQSVS